MNQTAREIYAEAPGPRLARVSDAPTSGFRIPVVSPVVAPVGVSRPPSLPRFELLRAFAHDVFENGQSTLILIDLPGVPPQHASVALSVSGVHVHVHVIASTPALQAPPAGDYEAIFDVAPGVQPEWIAAIMDNGLLKIRIDQQLPEAARIEIATHEEELVWIG
jgi:HSP20 family molecular chaperone IbpA